MLLVRLFFAELAVVVVEVAVAMAVVAAAAVVAGDEKVKLEMMFELIGKFCVIDVVHHNGLIMLFLFSSCEVKKDSKWYGEDEWL
jgi:hypothetical protein